MIEGRSELSKKNKDSYWNYYFNYKTRRPDLHAVAQSEILKEISVRKLSDKFIDSQQLVSSVLSSLGDKHNFHRQFDEDFSFKKNQILGMQLYECMLKDDWNWKYTVTQHNGHKYEHAVYFSPS